MKKFLVKRIGYMIVTLVIIITATFYMMHSIICRTFVSIL